MLASVVRDSAGVAIVDNVMPGASDPVGWTLGPEPAVSIGSVGGDDRYQFFQVEAAVRMADGRIAVANRGTSEIRLYDDSGTYLEAWGAEGEGPGEFTNLNALSSWVGDSLMAWDRGLRRASFFDGDGNLGRTLSFAAFEGVDRPELIAVLGDGSMAVSGPASLGELSTQLLRPPRDFRRAGPDGAILGVLGTFPGAERFLEVNLPVSVNVTSYPFGRETLVAAWGAHVLISPTDRYTLDVYDTAGSLTRSVRTDAPASPLTEQHMAAVVESRVAEASPEQAPGIRQTYAAMPLVETLPAFSDVVVDALDYLWVRSYRPPPEAPGPWVVFDPSGRVLGSLETPAGLELFEIGADYVLGRYTDDLDVEYVQLWTLGRK